MTAPAADELARTPAERRCLETLRELTGEVGGPMERHSVRVALLTGMLSERAGEEIDLELVTCAALLHDLGLYPPAATHAAYVTDSRRLAEEILRDEGWAGDRIQRCADAVERHHELRRQWGRGTECELMRRADLIEVSHGAVLWGLPRGELNGLLVRIPRKGFAGAVLRGLARAARERPGTLWRIVRPA